MRSLILQRLLWVVGVLVALAGAYMLYEGGRVNAASVRVIETKTGVAPGTTLSSANLTYVKVPPAAVNPRAAQNPQQLLGKILTVPLPKGQQILPLWLFSSNVTLDSTHIDLPLTVSAATSAADTLRAGARVSLMWTPGGLLNQKPQIEFLQDPLTIIAVRDAHGNVIGQPTGTPGVTPGAPAIVDLRVTESEALTLESQQQNGKLIVLGIQQGGGAQ